MSEEQPGPTRRPSATALWAGLALVVAGLVLIVVAWGVVAGEPDLHDQVAPLILAGIGGLAVVVIGLTAVHSAVTRRDDDEMIRQLDALTEVVRDLQGRKQ